LARLIAAPDATAPGRWHPRVARQILRLTLSLSRAGGLETALPEGILAALSFGHAIGDLHAAGTGPAGLEPARAALALLGGFAADPLGVAGELRALAREAAEPATRAAIEDAAGALAAGAALFRFGF
ncbi:MAG: hypothetical protein KGI51_10135, partial [Rhodospirillales bacterium]|nr:hypothetical protein [Rhodospirillales bacterium]